MHPDMNKNPDLLQNTDLVLGTIHNHSNCKFCIRMGLGSPLISRDSDIFEALPRAGSTEGGEETGS